VSGDTVLKKGEIFNLVIEAEKGSGNITNIIVQFTKGNEVIRVYDTGMNAGVINLIKLFNKGIEDAEQWSVIAIDKYGKNSSIQFTLFNDPSSGFGPLKEYTFRMGAQTSISDGCFMSLHSGKIYWQDTAFLIQDSIDILYYYDPAGDYNTIASPAANIDASIYTGATGLQNWTVKHESRFYKTAVSHQDFINSTNDSLMLVSYSPINAKRKAKNLIAGDIYTFRTASGRYGMFYISAVSGAAEGYVDGIMKVQL
jgi:hypothetical protein